MIELEPRKEIFPLKRKHSQKRNSELILQYKPCYEQGEKGQTKRSVPRRTLTVFKTQNHSKIFNLSFSQWHISVDVCSRSTGNEPFIQNITVWTYKHQYCKRRQLGAYVLRKAFIRYRNKNGQSCVVCNHIQAAVCRLLTAINWHKRVMLLYIPAPTTAAMLLQCMLFVL